MPTITDPDQVSEPTVSDRAYDPTAFDRAFEHLDALNERICHLQATFLEHLAEADEQGLWRDTEASGMAHLLSIRYGISWWKADRLVQAAHALRLLPRTASALGAGELSIDKAVELCRFATPATEGALLRWAQGVSAGAVRHRADLEIRRSREQAERLERDRSLRYGYEEQGRRFYLQAELPAAEGAMVAGAIERVARSVPVMPGEQEEPACAEHRRADALVALCSGPEGASPEGSGRGPTVNTTVVVHVPMQTLSSKDGCGELEGGGIVQAEVVRRLLCTSALQVVVEDEGRDPVAMTPSAPDPSPSLMRQLRYRDRECRFPGCGARRFTQAHHIRWRSRGGRTLPGNLVLLCFFHHKLVHEHGWGLARDSDDEVRWFRPDGTRYRSGPAPPRKISA